MSYIANHIDHPQMAIDDNKEGTVNGQFMVDENGKIQNARVFGSKLGDGLDEEAERVIKHAEVGCKSSQRPNGKNAGNPPDNIQDGRIIADNED